MMADEPDKDKMFRAYLSEGETGWVEDLGKGKVKIWNIPWAGRYNLNDVVQVDHKAYKENPYEPIPGEIIERPYHARTILHYAAKEDFPKLRAWAGETGAAVEGLIGPTKDKPGFVAVAAPKEEDILFIVKKLKLPKPKGWTPNTLED
jgi:hypothetical protein